MEIATIIHQIQDAKRQSQIRSWDKTLTQRKREELEFHNRDRDRAFVANLSQDTFEMLHGNKKYYSATQLSKEYIDGWIAENVPGKVVLDYACGDGGFSIRCSKAGAALVVGVDLSDVSVENATRDAQAVDVGSKCIFLQGDCEATGLPDNCFDLIICSGMLHHLDLSHAFPELRRILRPGGKILAIEALNYNPLIKLYRWITPSMRTEWEAAHILSLRDIEFARRFFTIGKIRYFHIFAIFAPAVPVKPVRDLALRVCNWMDRACTRIPLVRLMAWQFTFELIKRRED